MVGIVLAGAVIQKFGTDEQKAAHLPATLTGDQALVPALLRARRRERPRFAGDPAERDGDRWIVNGQKVWTSGGRYSDWGILMARTDPNARSTRASRSS